MSKNPILPKVEVARPPSSNKDLSFTSRFSLSPGLLYPQVNKLLAPGDKVSLTVTSRVMTLPPLGPLMGSFKVQIDTFFSPLRLHLRALHDDRTRFDPYSVLFPYFEVAFPGSSGNTPTTKAVHETSLVHFLGVPSIPYSYANANQGYRRRYTAFKLLAYYDIFRGYYANTQENNFYAITALASGQATLSAFPLSQFNTIREAILGTPLTTPYAQTIYGATSAYSGVAGTGLLARTYLPDRFHTYVNSALYSDITNATRVTVSASQFTMDDLRFADKLNTMMQKTLISGGRFSDWQKIQWGVTPRGINEVPSFLGSSSYELQFEDIVQVGAATEDSPLGTLGSAGSGYGRSRPIHYTATEHGYLVSIISLIPRVDYYQGTPFDFNLRNMGQLHVPALDGIGFQDLLYDEFVSNNTAISSSGEPTTPTAVGKQPAWTQYTTATNELHGDFANPSGTMFLTLARRFPDSITATTPITYINPADFNYIFADASLTSQNFWMQCNFSLHVRRHMSNHVMPHL